MSVTLGLMAAMEAEIHLLLSFLTNPTEQKVGNRVYYAGHLFGQAVVIAFSRWGKVAAATTATELIRGMGVKQIIFSGVAGALDKRLAIGDIVIGQACFQHDMDARPLMPRFEIPLTGKQAFETSPSLRNMLQAAAQEFVAHDWAQVITPELQQQFGLSAPHIMTGDIASGDQFIADPVQAVALKEALPSVLCAEMEGAAVAQVCADYGIPFGLLRVISDTADEQASLDFPAFVSQVASHYTLGVLRRGIPLVTSQS